MILPAYLSSLHVAGQLGFFIGYVEGVSDDGRHLCPLAHLLACDRERISQVFHSRAAGAIILECSAVGNAWQLIYRRVTSICATSRMPGRLNIYDLILPF